MKKKILSFALVIIFSMLLCSCSGNSPDKMFSVKLPSGEKLELYMSRDKVEEIMSSYEYDYNDHSHKMCIRDRVCSPYVLSYNHKYI